MKDPWIGRASALLIGGLSGAYLPEQARLSFIGVLLLLGVRLMLWRPRDFFGRVFRPEILLLGASLLIGFVYGALADRILAEPVTLDHVQIVGNIRDWNMVEDGVVGIIRVEAGEGGAIKVKGNVQSDFWSEIKGQTEHSP